MARYTASDDGKVIGGKIVVWLRPPTPSPEATPAVAQKSPAQQVAPLGATVREVDGSILTDARFEDHRDLEQGGAAWLLARAEGLDGREVQLVLERETEAGEWVPVGQAVTTVRSGIVRAAVPCDTGGNKPVPAVQAASKAGVPEADGSTLSGARFEDPRDLEEGGTVWLLARAAGLEGRGVQVVLEREDKPGEWTPVGQATATVRSGTVRAAVTPDREKLR